MAAMHWEARRKQNVEDQRASITFKKTIKLPPAEEKSAMVSTVPALSPKSIMGPQGMVSSTQRDIIIICIEQPDYPSSSFFFTLEAKHVICNYADSNSEKHRANIDNRFTVS